jgi:hypothetical protein
VDLVDLTVRRFKHCGDLGDLQRLFEPSKLIGSHGQVGAWSLVDVMAIDTNEFIVDVALEKAWSTLQVESFPIVSGFSEHDGSLVRLALGVVGIPIDVRHAILLIFSIP